MSILTWADGQGRVANDSIMFDLYEKPQLSFYYEALFYDEQSQMFIKVLVDHIHKALTSQERLEIKRRIDDLIEGVDYEVYTYDEEGIFRSKILKSKIELAEKLDVVIAGYTMITPPGAAAKWNGEEWKSVVAVIMDTGELRLHPDSVCQLCLLAFTQEEWDAFPHRPQTPYETWDFKAEVFRDQRTLEYVKVEAKKLVSGVLEAVRQEWVGPYIIEQSTWIKQSEEAMEWLKDNTTPTPFIDVIVGKATAREKEEFCLDVKMRSEKTWEILANIQAHQVWSYVQINACQTVAEVDDFVFHYSDTDYTKLFIGE